VKTSIIVTTYNKPQELFITLESILIQSNRPDEVIIADDGSDEKTIKYIEKFLKNYPIRIIHSWHKDRGFRAAEARNLAISKSRYQYIILVDGDVILHKHFVRDHINHARMGQFIQGTRVYLDAWLSSKILQGGPRKINFFSKHISSRKNIINSMFLSKFFSVLSHDSRGTKTCNMSFYRKDFLKVNGFNNNFVGWGREDTDLVIRFNNIKLKRLYLRFQANQLHLWHHENSRITLEANDKLLNLTNINNLTFCENGINKFCSDKKN